MDTIISHQISKPEFSNLLAYGIEVMKKYKIKL